MADVLFMHLSVPDRRRGYRQQASAMAILRPVNQPGDHTGKTLDAHVFDLSVYGVGMSVREAIELGRVFDFAMCDGRQSGKRIEIKSCRLRGDNMFDVGGQFC